MGTAFARGGHADTSFEPITQRAATGIDHRNFIYRIGGYDYNGTRIATSFMSYDGGQSWTDMGGLPGSTRFAPGRERSNLVVDEADNLYLIGGLLQTGVYTTTPLISRNQGMSWQQLPFTPWGGRGTALALSQRSRRLNREVFTYVSGWDGATLHNDVWISSDYARTWVRLPHAPFVPRDSSNGEITADGVIVLVGGQKDQGTPPAIDSALNDVWVSLDGGWSWGQCVEDAPFADRRDLLTVFDDQAFLYVAGGTNWWANPQRWYNDVWRSSFAFSNIAAVSAACGVSIPACGAGLTCWPGAGVSFYPNGSVTCQANRACAGLPEVRFDFVEQTPVAGWAGRFFANTELFPKSFTYTTVSGQSKTAPAYSLILQGGTNAYGTINNDIWTSSDQGRNWDLIAGYARTAAQGGEIRAGGTAYQTSYSPALLQTTGIVDEVNGIIYRVGGFLGTNSFPHNDVWRSTNAVAWTKMAATNLPPRWGSNVVVDAKGKIFVVGGAAEGTNALRDMWVSTNGGASFTAPTGATAPPFMTGGRGRSGGMLLARYSPALNKDVLWFGGGYNNIAQFNDVWASSDDGVTWVPVTAAAPFIRRDSGSAEVTAAGLIVLAGGQTSYPSVEVLNDVWVSADGGYTWGLCVNDSSWSDRREVSTVFDADEALYVLGGRSATSNYRVFNDVYRSTIQFSNLRLVQSACSISIPACGPGLTCWPGAPGTSYSHAGGVTCPALEQCKRGILPSSTAPARPVVRSSSSSTGAAKPKPPPYDPCYDDYPVTDPDCDTYEGSTGGGDSTSSSSLPPWLIALIVILVAVVALAGIFMWRSRSKAQQLAGSLLPMTGGSESLMAAHGEPHLSLSTS